jgi:hypothetical protein
MIKELQLHVDECKCEAQRGMGDEPEEGTKGECPEEGPKLECRRSLRHAASSARSRSLVLTEFLYNKNNYAAVSHERP